MTKSRARRQRDADSVRRAKIVAWVGRFPGATVGDVARVFNLPRGAAAALLRSAVDRHELTCERHRYSAAGQADPSDSPARDDSVTTPG